MLYIEALELLEKERTIRHSSYPSDTYLCLGMNLDHETVFIKHSPDFKSLVIDPMDGFNDEYLDGWSIYGLTLQECLTKIKNIGYSCEIYRFQWPESIKRERLILLYPNGKLEVNLMDTDGSPKLTVQDLGEKDWIIRSMV